MLSVAPRHIKKTAGSKKNEKSKMLNSVQSFASPLFFRSRVSILDAKSRYKKALRSVPLHARSKSTHDIDVSPSAPTLPTPQTSSANFHSLPGEYIYALKTREFIRCNEKIIKIGRTSNLRQRLISYPRGSSLLMCLSVSDSLRTEGYVRRRLLTMSRLCFLRKDIGREWFELCSGITEDEFLIALTKIIYRLDHE